MSWGEHFLRFTGHPSVHALCGGFTHCFLSVTNDHKVYSSFGAICHVFFSCGCLYVHIFSSLLCLAFLSVRRTDTYMVTRSAPACHLFPGRSTLATPPDRHHLCSVQRSRHSAASLPPRNGSVCALLPGDGLRAPRLPRGAGAEGAGGSGRVSFCALRSGRFERHVMWRLNGVNTDVI